MLHNLVLMGLASVIGISLTGCGGFGSGLDGDPSASRAKQIQPNGEINGGKIEANMDSRCGDREADWDVADANANAESNDYEANANGIIGVTLGASENQDFSQDSCAKSPRKNATTNLPKPKGVVKISPLPEK